MRIKNLPSIESMDGSQDALVIEQTDGSEDKSRKVSPSQLKQYILNDMDEVPTQDSDDPVKSGGVFSTIDDIYSVMGQNGAKNLIPCPYYRASGYSANGMTTTYDSDGVMTINKVAGSSTAFFALTYTTDNYCLKPNTKYKLLAEFDNTTQLSVFAKYGDIDLAIINKKSTGKYAVNFTTPQTLEGQENIAIYATASDTETNAKVKVMIMLASDTDETYQPYAKTNKELTEVIGDLTQTRLTGDSVAEQLGDASGQIAIEKVPNSFITLESGISITTNQVFRQGNHIFGWITFAFSAQTPNNLKLGKLNTGYTTNYLVRMIAGLGTEAWACENVGYATKGVDNIIYLMGYFNNISRAAHIYLDYVV